MYKHNNGTETVVNPSVKSLFGGMKRVFGRSTLFPLAFDADPDNSVAYVRCIVPASMKTQERRTVYIRLNVNASNEVTNIVDTHCSCIASVAGDCQHIAAALLVMHFLILESGRIKDAESSLVSCTSQPCAWKLPSGNHSADVILPIEEYLVQGKKALSGSVDVGMVILLIC